MATHVHHRPCRVGTIGVGGYDGHGILSFDAIDNVHLRLGSYYGVALQRANPGVGHAVGQAVDKHGAESGGVAHVPGALRGLYKYHRHRVGRDDLNAVEQHAVPRASLGPPQGEAVDIGRKAGEAHKGGVARHGGIDVGHSHEVVALHVAHT